MNPRLKAATILTSEHLPGWLFLLSGLTIIAAAAWMPAYLENRQLAWQHDLQALQAQRLSEQAQAYRTFISDVDSGDPVLLEKLAYHYLRLKPVGTLVLATPMLLNPPSASPKGSTPAPRYALQPLAQPFSNAEAWLQRPMPRPGVDYPRYGPVESLLERITTSPARYPVMGLGLVCLCLGLMAPARRIQVTTEITRHVAPAAAQAQKALERVDSLRRRLVQSQVGTLPSTPQAVEASPVPNLQSEAEGFSLGPLSPELSKSEPLPAGSNLFSTLESPSPAPTVVAPAVAVAPSVVAPAPAPTVPPPPAVSDLDRASEKSGLTVSISASAIEGPFVEPSSVSIGASGIASTSSTPMPKP